MRANINIHNMDCMVAMKEMEDNQFDLAIVDPPYGIGVNSMNMGSRKTIKPTDKKWDKKVPDDSYFKELKRVSAEQIIWGGNYFNLTPTRCFLVWDKGEMMYRRSFAECELAWTSFDKSARMIIINPTQLDRIHPTQKPVLLYKWLLQNHAKKNDKILDTHLGSGSIAIACWDLKFDLTGYELDEEHYNAAMNRFNTHCTQGQLF